MGDEHKDTPTTKFVECGFYKGKGMAVFTSGGDSQGMNAALRAIVRMGLYLGCEVYFIKEGYQGMVDGGHHIVQATWSSVSSIIHKGGTIIGSARCMDFHEREGRLKAAKNLIKRRINNIVVIGGDGSLTGANIFREEWLSLVTELESKGDITSEEAMKFNTLQIIGLVGSIDNDFCGTDMTIGTNSALHRIFEAIDAITSTAYSHQRTFILEIMGRNCGYLAIIAALGSEADFMFIPEHPPEDNWKQILCDKLIQERAAGRRLNIVIVSEGAKDRSGKRITAGLILEVIVERLKQDARVSILGHMQRGGNASAFDRVLACRMGAQAVLALMEAKPGEDALVIALDGNKVVRLPLMQCVEKTKAVSAAMAKNDWKTAGELRGTSFMRNLNTYFILNEAKPTIALASARYVYAVIYIGAPASGMNAAVYAFIRSSIAKGDVIYGIQDSIEGLCAGHFQRMQWNDVNGWVGMGGANLGTKRTLPEGRFDVIAEKLKKFNIQALLILGGFEAYQAGLQLVKVRNKYPEFRIPILVLPSTISNNVPGTEFSLGCDTALNEITEICDRIRQSAQGTKRRAFIIETMGGYCGYLATLAGLAAGADAAYIFEEKFSIKDLEKDVYHMAAKMSEGVQRGLILRNEKCNEFYNADFMYRLFAEEGKGLFSARMNILGHMQQGGSASPFDRSMGIKYGVEASNWFEKLLRENSINNFEDRPNLTADNTACLLGIIKRKYQCSPLNSLIEQTDFQYRIPKNVWWLKLRPLMRIFGKHFSVYEEEGEYLQIDEPNK